MKLFEYDRLQDKLSHWSTRPDKDLDSFKFIAEFYGHEVGYADSQNCDIVIFDLDTYHHYTNFNPVFFISDADWKTIRARNVPVVFWHSGECHALADSDFLRFSEQHTNGKIWYVDSNINTETDRHLFFDSAEVFWVVNKNQHWQHDLNLIEDCPYEYRLSAVAGRGELHKNIICNLLRNELNGYCHYSNPQKGQWWEYENYNGLDNLLSVPNADPFVEFDVIRSIRSKTMITISLGTYFIVNHPNWINFNPCYVTEKVFYEAGANNPVVPVSHAGTVKYYRNLGIEFPGWIDYSYDNIKDHNKRMHAIITELHRLNNLGNLENLTKKFKANTKNNQVISKLTFRQDFDRIVKQIMENP